MGHLFNELRLGKYLTESTSQRLYRKKTGIRMDLKNFLLRFSTFIEQDDFAQCIETCAKDLPLREVDASILDVKKCKKSQLRVFLSEGHSGKYFPTVEIEGEGSSNNVIILAGNYDSDCKIRFTGSNGQVFLAGNTKWCRFKGSILMRSDTSFALGRGVSANRVQIIVSGPGVLVGDDCMIANRVEIRTHSGHGFLNLKTGAIEGKSQSLVIEPHVWIGENAKLFMVPKVGACSVVAYNAVVTREVPRLSTAKGFPAKSVAAKDKIWVRSANQRNVELAQKTYNAFCL